MKYVQEYNLLLVVKTPGVLLLFTNLVAMFFSLDSICWYYHLLVARTVAIELINVLYSMKLE